MFVTPQEYAAWRKNWESTYADLNAGIIPSCKDHGPLAELLPGTPEQAYVGRSFRCEKCTVDGGEYRWRTVLIPSAALVADYDEAMGKKFEASLFPATATVATKRKGRAR